LIGRHVVRMAIRIGIVGCGKIATRHLEAYKRIGKCEVVAVCDVDRDRAKIIADKFNSVAFTSFERILERKDIDAIDVCVPTDVHHSIILRALDCGKHVFCEKPLTHRLEYALEIEEKRKETGNIIQVGFLYRFHPSFQKLQEILKNNIIGKPYFALFRIGGRGGHKLWKHKRNRGGGAIFEMMVHMLDLAYVCFGDFVEANNLYSETILKRRIVEGREMSVDAEDFILARLKSKSDVQVFCEADIITPSYMNLVEVHGDNGSYFGSILHFLPSVIYCVEPRGLYNEGINILEYPFVDLIEKELEYFLDTLYGKVNHLNSVEESIKILEIIQDLNSKKTFEGTSNL